MATAATASTSASSTSDSEEIHGFDPEILRAPFALRCAALSIDYITLVALPAIWLVSGRLLSDASGSALGKGIWIAAIGIFAINFVILPLVRGQSLGKLVTGLTILESGGRRPGVGRLLLRNTLGYLLTVATGGLGFLIAAFNSSGRTLHDLVSGTIVIRGRKS